MDVSTDAGNDLSDLGVYPRDMTVIGPSREQLTESEARGAWATPIAPQFFSASVYMGTQSPPALLKLSPTDGMLRSWVSLAYELTEQPGFASVEALGLANEFAYVTTGRASTSRGVWFWVIDLDSDEVVGARRIEGCVPAIDNVTPMQIGDSLAAVPCTDSVVTVDITAPSTPEIGQSWAANSDVTAAYFFEESQGGVSFWVTQFGQVQRVGLNSFGMQTSSTLELPMEYRSKIGARESGQALYVLHGRSSGIPASGNEPAVPPNALLSRIEGTQLGLERTQSHNLDSVLSDASPGRVSPAFWTDGSTHLVLSFQDFADRFNHRLLVIDLTTEPASLLTEYDISSLEDGYTAVTSILEHEGDLLLFRYSQSAGAPAFQKVALAELGIN